MSKKNVFVFVVCGKDIHINTLNFSINYLRHFTANEIIVVTDIHRNAISIEHPNILNIQTPKEFDNHQASIFLKTRLHEILPQGNNYCYLDSDVIAISHKVDEIFEYLPEPVIFASDHCRLNHFSPYAINCNCYNEQIEKQNLFKHYFEKYNSDYSNLYQKPATRELLAELRDIKRYPLKSIPVILKYLSVKYFPGLRYFNLNKKL
ncbi:MAG: hypothetical protein HY738_00175, partial [Bacteroidia bacterium]|nr:hypothetical protein [Bacteroidia bacterium]